MKHLVFLMVAIAACAALAKTSTPEGWTDDYDAALKRAAAENKLVLADFSGSDWCGWCKKLDKEVFDTEEFRKGATNEYVLLMVDTPQDQELLSEKAKKQNPKLVEKYKVRGFPTVLVLDAKGGVVFQGGYEQGGPKKYLKMLRRGAKEAPDIAMYIKPIEDVLNKYDADMQKDSEAMKERLEKEFPAPKLEVPSARNARMKKMKTRGGEIFFGEIFAKYESLYDKAFAEAKAMKVPPHLELKKLELISRQEQSFLSMKMAKLRFEAEQNGYLDEDDSDEDDGEEDDDVDEDGEPVPNDGHWHGIAYAESWAACVQTNAALPTAWKYFTEQFRPYVRRQLLPADEKAFAKETAALVDGIARTLWTPHNTSYVTWSLGADFRLAQSLRDRGCSNLTVRALATAGDFDAHMKRHGSIWPKGKESDVYRGVAAELLDKGASPLLRWLYVRRIGEKIVNCGTPDKDMVDGLKERPQDLRVVYNLIGSPECAKAADPWFGLMAEAKAENSAAWKCRGGGYAGKVTEEGWKGFYEHLGKATNLMERAYALHPELPETAALMMEVKAPIDEDAMNTWFDRVLALEVDNPDAWQTLMFYSLQRWRGSVQDLRDLSAILATITREDASGLRYLSAQTLATAAIEADAKDPSAFFRDPELRSRYLSALRPLVDGEGVDDETAGCARKGIVDRFWDVGEYEEAGKAYRELIASAPVRFSLPGDHWGDYMEIVLPAFGGPHEKELIALERHWQRNMAKVKKPSAEAKAEATRLLQPLVAKMGELTSAEKRLVYARMDTLGLAVPVATDGDWQVLPVEAVFPGWGKESVCWSYSDGAYRLSQVNAQLDWKSPLPADYELEVDVAIHRALDVCLDWRTSKEIEGESFGCPYIYVRRVGNAKTGWKARISLFSWHWKMKSSDKRSIVVDVPLENPDARHRFSIVVCGGEVTVSVDGRRALASGERFKEHFAVSRNDSWIKVGGSKIDIYGVRYRKVK